MYMTIAIPLAIARFDSVGYSLVLKRNIGVQHHLYISVHTETVPCFSVDPIGMLPFSFFLLNQTSTMIFSTRPSQPPSLHYL